MQVMSEALGLALPGIAVMPPDGNQLEEIVQEACKALIGGGGGYNSH